MTVLGKQTVAELRDLVASKDYVIKEIQKAAADYNGAWQVADRPAWEKWTKDWLAFIARYQVARKKADAAFEKAKGWLAPPENMNPAEEEFEAILRACTAAKNGAYTDTDLQGLHNRLVNARQVKIDFAANPQPRASSDVDAKVLKAIPPPKKTVKKPPPKVVAKLPAPKAPMTILGQHTIAELKDLVAAKDYQITQIQKHAADFDARWKVEDKPARDLWLSQWLTFVNRYQIARKAAQSAIESAKGLFSVRESVNPSEAEYEAILRACTAEKDGPYTDTDLQGLHNRLTAASQKKVDFSKAPQPRPGTDADQNAYKAVDDTIKAGEKAAKETLLSTPVLVGGVIGLGVLYVASKRL